MPSSTKRSARKPVKSATAAELVIKHLKARASGARNYARGDECLRRLRSLVQAGEPITLPSEFDKELTRLLGAKAFTKLGAKKQAVIEDLYAESDKVFRAHGIGRFEIKIRAAG